MEAAAPEQQANTETQADTQAEETPIRECIVCMAADATSRAALCQHWDLCTDCALKVDKCPVCRKEGFLSHGALCSLLLPTAGAPVYPPVGSSFEPLINHRPDPLVDYWTDDPPAFGAVTTAPMDESWWPTRLPTPFQYRLTSNQHSFALRPEGVVPSGPANMTRLPPETTTVGVSEHVE